jgi:hypothetical protein
MSSQRPEMPPSRGMTRKSAARWAVRDGCDPSGGCATARDGCLEAGDRLTHLCQVILNAGPRQLGMCPVVAGQL